MSDYLKYIDEKTYRLFKGASWPSYEDFVTGSYVVDEKIKVEINNLIERTKQKYNNIASPNTKELSIANQQRQKQIFFDKKHNTRICSIPWKTMGINSNGNVFICESPSWIPIFVGNILEVNDIFEILNSESALKIRNEIVNGRYYYCNNKLCSFFHSIDPQRYNSSPSDKEDYSPLELTSTAGLLLDRIPANIIFDFDYTCNFKCPSCRVEAYNWNNDPIRRPINNQIVEKVKKLIIDKINDTRVTIRWCGGEPFMSEVYLDLFEYIIKVKNKNIQNIVQTNGSLLLSKKQLVTNLLPYISEMRISFDAGSPEVYAKTRIGGNWERLIENVKFLVAVKKENNLATKVTADFVVQKNNYKDIPSYFNLCQELGIEANPLQKMWNWGTWSDEQFDEMNVYTSTHTLFNEVTEYIKKSGKYATRI